MLRNIIGLILMTLVVITACSPSQESKTLINESGDHIMVSRNGNETIVAPGDSLEILISR